MIADKRRSPQAYASDAMVERRQRMLKETWNLISEKGVQGFSVREICNRVGIAQGTFYNAFGTRENAVALAVTEYTTMVTDEVFKHSNATIEGRIERLARLHVRICSNRRYIAATMAVF